MNDGASSFRFFPSFLLRNGRIYLFSSFMVPIPHMALFWEQGGKSRLISVLLRMQQRRTVVVTTATKSEKKTLERRCRMENSLPIAIPVNL